MFLQLKLNISILIYLMMIGTKGVITDEISIIVCSIVKLFIGELMEESLDVMREQTQMNSNSTNNDDDVSKVSVDNVTTAHIK